MQPLSDQHLPPSTRKIQPHVVVVVGPTASGKTTLSLSLARALDGEIISADSRQMYRFMDIGTAKVTAADRASIKHYFVDERSPDEACNAGEFGKLGREIIDEILLRKKVPIVVGGSGLYVRALVDGFFEGPSANPELRASLYRRAHEEGNEKLLRELREVDPDAARGMLPSNIRRIVRALEVLRLSGSTITELQEQKAPLSFTPLFFGLRWERAQLYERINYRIEAMMAQGFLREVENLSRLGYSRDLNALQTVGYAEAFEFLEGKIGEEEMIQLIKRNSRRYAKRQLTWFRRDERIKWFDINDEASLPAIAQEIVKSFNAAF